MDRLHCRLTEILLLQSSMQTASYMKKLSIEIPTGMPSNLGTHHHYSGNSDKSGETRTFSAILMIWTKMRK